MHMGISLESHYAELESRWCISNRVADYRDLVVPNGNSELPFHSWFHLKEAFSSRLLDQLLSDEQWPNDSTVNILDPFCGSGTTLISATHSKLASSSLAIGIERNPFIATVATAKVAGAIQGASLAEQVRGARNNFLRRYRTALKRDHLTASATLNNLQYFPTEHVRSLLALRTAAEGIENLSVRSIFLTAVAACVEPAGRLRRDGRALRFVPSRTLHHPVEVLGGRLDRMIADLQAASPGGGSVAEVVFGDARHIGALVGELRFDWIIFSPPYPNNIDYTEVYKNEAWILGKWRSNAEMREQRLSTVRSHPSVRFPDHYHYQSTDHAEAISALLAPLLCSVPVDQYARGRKQVIQGYADDMYRVFLACRKVARGSSTRLAYVVGNSVHGGDGSSYVIAADLLLARLAELAGWKVEQIMIARPLKRRVSDSKQLRESVVLLSPA